MQDFDPFGFFAIFGILFFIIPIIIFVAFAFVIVKVCQAGSGSSGGFTLEPPSFVMTEGQRPRGRGDGSDVRTVRIPNSCPSCGASLTHETIDWVGPLEASCTYCGGTVRATFERI